MKFAWMQFTNRSINPLTTKSTQKHCKYRWTWQWNQSQAKNTWILKHSTNLIHHNTAKISFTGLMPYFIYLTADKFWLLKTYIIYCVGKVDISCLAFWGGDESLLLWNKTPTTSIITSLRMSNFSKYSSWWCKKMLGIKVLKWFLESVFLCKNY